MSSEAEVGIARYEAMIGVAGWINPDDPEQAQRDLEAYGKSYAAEADESGKHIYSPAKIIRFLVEVCGLSYNEALAAVVDDIRRWPTADSGGTVDAASEARSIRERTGNIIESLFDLKIVRLARQDDDYALEYNRAVTRLLTEMRKPGVEASGLDK